MLVVVASFEIIDFKIKHHRRSIKSISMFHYLFNMSFSSS